MSPHRDSLARTPLSSMKKLKQMSKSDLEDEVMLLRAQVKVLQDWVALHNALPHPKPEKYIVFQHNCEN